MNVNSYGELFSMLQKLEHFCTDIGQASDVTGWATQAEAHRQIAQGLQRVISQHLAQEGRVDALVSNPLAEIMRIPYRKENVFENRPVFIIGNRRSGTTLLAYLLNASANLCALPENFLAGTIASADALMAAGHLVMKRMDEPFPQYLIRLGQFVDDIYAAHAAKVSKTRWVSKELFAARKLDVLDAMFDYRPQYVFIVRHGLDVAYSCSSRFVGRDGMPSGGKTSLNVETYLDEWIENTDTTMDFCERNRDRCFFMRYEDLVADPASVSERLFGFLNEPWDANVLSKMGQQHLSDMGDNKILARGARIGSSEPVWTAWPKPLLKTLGRRANEVLRRVGYEPVGIEMP